MGNRLTKIYTRTGDDGSTGLSGNVRVQKDDVRVVTMAALDELNSALGLLLSHELCETHQKLLLAIQHDLFEVGGEISLPERQIVSDQHVAYLEQQLDALNESLPALKEFILPGGCQAAALCHLARSICRRAESHFVAMADKHEINQAALRYINRLSDLLFVLARAINKEANHGETFWNKSPPA
ncbi:MAG: cob(I)yrinic acid a,c-diamide adenosyltransferase [Gammaproteobacteria bacterium]|nr:cob(I)yrinic acid a,c-diamide adenosyltransferase [Gammaproteobacteria bacterium]